MTERLMNNELEGWARWSSCTNVRHCYVVLEEAMETEYCYVVLEEAMETEYSQSSISGTRLDPAPPPSTPNTKQ